MEELKHFSHDHPLMLTENHSLVGSMCCGCNEPITIASYVYTCSSSNISKFRCTRFFLHKKCAELPPKIEHLMHLKHPLPLYSSPTGTISKKQSLCSVCGIFWRWFTYQCSDCNFVVCLRCAFEEHLVHFSHQHLLILRPKLSKSAVCYGCNKRIFLGDSVYSCFRSSASCDNFFLHKSCAELSPKLEYPMHPEHPLTLCWRPPYIMGSCFCNVCGVIWSWFSYTCIRCEFDICLECAFRDRSFNLGAHNHPLTLLPKEATFKCDACCTEYKDFSYVCTTCPFWIHKSCAFSAKTLMCKFHNHPLVLAYSIPEQFRPWHLYCDICKQIIHTSYWIYHCEKCRFFAHIKCATTSSNTGEHLRLKELLRLRSSEGDEENTSEVDEEDISDEENVDRADFQMPNGVSLPPFYEESQDGIVHRSPQAISLTDDVTTAQDSINQAHSDHPLVLSLKDDATTAQDSINQAHSDHPLVLSLTDIATTTQDSINQAHSDHPLVLSLIDDTTTAQDNIKHWAHSDHPLVLFDEHHTTNMIMSHSDDQKICEACVCPILTDPFYGCFQCKFFMHKHCAKLPQKLKHSSHPEHVLLGGKYDKPNFYITCSKCGCFSNGVYFSCEVCEFYVDIRCAMRPTSIKHEAHKHDLDQLGVQRLCKGCGEFISNMSFGCKDCEFYLHEGCASLPDTINHRWDPHPIPLVYPPVKDHPDVFYCEICEEEIDLNYWLYFCCDCDQSFHIHCLFGYYAFKNIKFGATMKIINHPHSLTFVEMETLRYPSECYSCGDRIPDRFPVLECKPCFFRLCMRCSVLPGSVKTIWDPHPIQLLSPPLQDDLEIFECEICGKKMNPRIWLYHCRECSQSFHPSCLYPYYDPRDSHTTHRCFGERICCLEHY